MVVMLRNHRLQGNWRCAALPNWIFRCFRWLGESYLYDRLRQSIPVMFQIGDRFDVSQSTTTQMFVQQLRIKHRNTTLLAIYEGNPLVSGGFSSQSANNVESDSTSWCHHRPRQGYWWNQGWNVLLSPFYPVEWCHAPHNTDVFSNCYNGSNNVMICRYNRIKIKQTHRLLMYYICLYAGERESNVACFIFIKCNTTRQVYNPGLYYELSYR